MSPLTKEVWMGLEDLLWSNRSSLTSRKPAIEKAQEILFKLDKEVLTLRQQLQFLTETNEALRKQIKGADEYVFPKL